MKQILFYKAIKAKILYVLDYAACIPDCLWDEQE